MCSSQYGFVKRSLSRFDGVKAPFSPTKLFPTYQAILLPQLRVFRSFSAVLSALKQVQGHLIGSKIRFLLLTFSYIHTMYFDLIHSLFFSPTPPPFCPLTPPGCSPNSLPTSSPLFVFLHNSPSLICAAHTCMAVRPSLNMVNLPEGTFL